MYKLAINDWVHRQMLSKCAQYLIVIFFTTPMLWADFYNWQNVELIPNTVNDIE